MSKPLPAIDLRVIRSLELLGQLRKTVADYAERERQLARKLRSSGFKSSRKYQEEIEATEAKLAAQQVEINAGIEEEESPVHAVAEHRRAKVRRMHQVATKQNPRRGHAVSEGWRGDQQMRKIVLSQKLAADQQAVDTEFAEFYERLKEERGRLAALRKTLEGYFSGYRSFKTMLRQAAEPKTEASVTALANRGAGILPAAKPELELSGRQDARATAGEPNTKGARVSHPPASNTDGTPVLPLDVSGHSIAKEDHENLLKALKSQLAEVEVQARAFRRHLVPRLFRPSLWLVWLSIMLLASAGEAWYLSQRYPWEDAVSYSLPTVLVIAVLLWFLRALGFDKAKPDVEALSQTMANAARLRLECRESAKAAHELAHRNLQKQFERDAAEIDAQRARAPQIEKEFVARAQAKVDAQLPRLLTKIDAQSSGRLVRLESTRNARLEDLQSAAEAKIKGLRDAQESETAEVEAEEKAQWDALNQSWQLEITPFYQAVDALNDAAAPLAPVWNKEFVEGWQPATSFHLGMRFARLEADLTLPQQLGAAAAGASLPPHENDLMQGQGCPRYDGVVLSASDSPPQKVGISLPLVLTFPDQASLLFESSGSGEKEVVETLNNLILQLLATIPPGKISFTIIDPVSLGQNFAGLMHLSDYEESLINRRIWTQRDQIEERLEELSEHIEKVIQMYLRNEYATITEYNEQAGSVAEKYQFLVIADFPANFSESAAKRLQSIATSGPRCGIFTLIHRDTRQPLPEGFAIEELRRNSICIRREGTNYLIGKEQAEAGAALVFNPPPTPALAVELVHKIGQGSIDSNRVQVPFAQIAPREGEFWTNDTTNELKIAVGRTGATKHQYLSIGKGTRQHALFAGKTGSGKSTLFHVIITNLALACSPEQVEFWLIDFKKGVEFKCYASKRLPHARVIAIESDREFALSVLQRVDGELKRRGDMFRKLGVQDIAGYKRAGGQEHMPRSLLLIDEFQEFFVEDDTIAQTASLLFDRIVRQGRAFGIHVLLGSQTLGGAYSLARATLGQMVIRVALQCNEADAYLIMDENNSAPRLLSRPGEGIYNDAAGAVEGNSPFQVVWLPDEERDHWLDKVQALNATSLQRRVASPIVFEGNAPADVHENDELREVLESTPSVAPVTARCWLGAPNSIKGPTEVAFNRQSGNHLLIVGQRDEAALTMLGVSLVALAAQYPPGTAKFVLVHASVPGSADALFIDDIVAAVSRESLTVSRGGDLAEIMAELGEDLKSRLGSDAASDAPSVFILVHGLHKFKKLRQEDDFSFSMSDEPAANPGAQFNEIITEGSSHGLHILTTVDTLNNVNRCLSRKAQSEFEMRVVFQMSANDSASLIDSPKASTLGLHRALYYNEHEGSLETFRPYATPEVERIRNAGKKKEAQSP